MAKLFALVNGLSKLFNTVVNDLDETKYDVSHVKDGVYAAYNVNQNTLFYILVDQNDKDLGYNGTYIYTNNTLFSAYDNKGGSFITSNLINANKDDATVFLFGKITPNKKTISPGLEENMPWTLSYHLQSYSPSNSTFNSEFDVFLYGNGHKVYTYYAFNANNVNIPICYHVIKEDETDGTCKVGICLYDTEDNNTLVRNIGFTINNYVNCKFSKISPVENDTLNGCIIIDAKQQGFVELNNDTLVKIPNIHINKIENSSLRNHPRLIYGLDNKGNIAPLISNNSIIPTYTLDNRVYNQNGFDYTRGLFYSNNYDGSLTYVEGNIYSSYAGMDYRYFDNVIEFNVTKPVYITGVIREDGLFQIMPNNLVGGYECAWTQDASNPNLDYWFVGYPQNTSEKYLVNLFETNKVYHLVNNKLVEYSKTISFTPTGTISVPVFYGELATISVSGQCEGTNSSSNVTIIGSTDSVNNITDVGELASIVLDTSNEIANFTSGKLPEISEKSVWVGYSNAVADAQVFTGATVTFTGSYKPSGTISQPIFHGDKITIIS